MTFYSDIYGHLKMTLTDLGDPLTFIWLHHDILRFNFLIKCLKKTVGMVAVTFAKDDDF